MYELQHFFKGLLNIVWKLALACLLLFGVLLGFNVYKNINAEPQTVEVKIVDKFQQDRGFTVLNFDFIRKENANHIRVDYVTKVDDKVKTNVFYVDSSTYEKLVVGEVYEARFKAGKLNYIMTDNSTLKAIKEEQNKKTESEVK